MNLDHFVIHIDNNEKILQDLKQKIEPLGFPFEPQWGKGTKGFKAANIWIGRQYFEIIRLLKQDGGGWTNQWVSKYNSGKRGIFCMFIVTDDIDCKAAELNRNGIKVGEPERITFKAMFGLIKKTLPWQLIYLPPIPGTDLEIGFIQYDPDPQDRIKQYLSPNADEHGILGIPSATVKLPLTEETVTFLRKIFPQGTLKENTFNVSLKNGFLKFESSEDVEVGLIAEVAKPELRGKSFRLENTVVYT